MFLDHLKGQAPVGHDPIPVRHQVVLGHRGQVVEVFFSKGIRFNSTQALTMPQGPLLGRAHQGT
jgi:hypothetical protein